MSTNHSEATSRGDILYETCLILVKHFENILKLSETGHGFTTRVFNHILHPEHIFVYAGTSTKVTEKTQTHPEHVVPCAVMIKECQRLILAGTHTHEEIAVMLKKHWKLAIITKAEQEFIDYELKYKSTMPSGWNFETGDTFERLRLANIQLVIDEQQ
jgi:predicted GIY-YIG superfamily endonuclease